jgi:pilus assembly protein FimV
MHDGTKASSAPAVPAGLDLDLDLDLSPAAVAARPLTPSTSEAIDQRTVGAAGRPTASLPSVGSNDGGAAPNVALPPSFDLPSPGTTAPSASAAPSASTQAAAAPEPGMIEFDLSALSLDLDPPASFDKGDIDTAPMKLATRPKDEESITAGFDVDSGDDPLATKLALAEEFSAIGDPDGARSLAEEVRNEASGDLKGRAERFLAELS